MIRLHRKVADANLERIAAQIHLAGHELTMLENHVDGRRDVGDELIPGQVGFREGTSVRQMIYSYVELQVTAVIAGHPPSPLILRVLGGKVGTKELIVQGAPQFHVGDEDILFVQGNGRQIFPLVRMMHGRYPVKKEAGTGREYIVRSNQVPLRATAEVGLPVAEGSAAALQRRMADTASALTPAQFTQQIRAAVRPDNLRLREN
jgi:hypothetical protein